MEQSLRGLHHPQTEADMARSTLDPDNFPAGRKPRLLKGHDTKSLGPSDSSDSGSDIVNAGRSVGDREMDDNSDRYGTGERRAAGKEPRVRENADRDADRVVDSGEAGLGGLDQVEEVRQRGNDKA
jgi:hypothetical protein